jgi:hypothetical protein
MKGKDVKPEKPKGEVIKASGGATVRLGDLFKPKGK